MPGKESHMEKKPHAGNLRAGQLTLPLDRPLGLRETTNPLPATGGDDAEAAEDARRNAPIYTLTLGRVVSITDYRDFALNDFNAEIGHPHVLLVAQGRTLAGCAARNQEIDPSFKLAAMLPDEPTGSCECMVFLMKLTACNSIETA